LVEELAATLAPTGFFSNSRAPKVSDRIKETGGGTDARRRRYEFVF
jgi:hypothetical protein